jgi:hypothetical protein
MTTIHHNGHIRSDWLNAGMGRTTAQRLIDNVTPILRENGAFGEYAHAGRRGPTDFLQVTSPNGWGDNHPGSATVKVRGCDDFRRYALGMLKAELISGGGAERLGRLMKRYEGSK